jgi:hypothetical protein
MSTPSDHVKMAVYEDDMATIATSFQPALLLRHLESYLSDLVWWPKEGRIFFNVVSNSIAMLFAKTGRRIPKHDHFNSTLTGIQSIGSIPPVM